MADVYIVKAKKTALRSPFSSSDTTVKLDELVDHKGNALTLADFGAWFVLVLKEGSNVEMTLCDGLTQNGDGTANCAVATNGRHLNATTPYAGSSTGLDFQTAEVIVTNDPYTVSQFASKLNAETISGLWTFPSSESLRPRASSDTDTAVAAAYVTFGQLGRTALAGGVPATDTTYGYSELGTAAETAAGTTNGGTGAPLSMTPTILAAQIQSSKWTFASTGGTVSAATLALTPTCTALTHGMVFGAHMTLSLNAGATLNLDGLGAKALYKYANGSAMAIEAGDCILNHHHLFQYDSDADVFLVINPVNGTFGASLMTEITNFFNNTDMTGAQAETLSGGASSNADTEHTHNPYALVKQSLLANVKYFIGGANDGMTFDSGAGGSGERTAFATFLDAAAGGGGEASLYIKLDNKGSDVIGWADNPNVNLAVRLAAENTTNDLGWGIFDSALTTAPSNASLTARHVAFLMDGATLYASVADGTTQNRTNVSSGLTLTNFNVYEIDITGGSQAVFKVNGTTVATLSTNFPTTSSGGLHLSFCTEAAATGMTVCHPFALKLTNLMT